MTGVFFVYGLAFFVLGLAVAIYPKKHSKFWLAQNVWLIAAFAVLHGLHEWLDMFVIIRRPPEIVSLQIIKSFLLPASFFFLLWFGIKSIIEVQSRYPHVKAVPLLFLIIWVGIVLGSKEPLLMADIWARYLLGVPGILLTSYGLMVQSSEIKQFGPRPILYLKVAALFFFFYCFFSGLVVPDARFFPASIFNYTVFAEIVGVKVQIFRTFCALGITFGVIKVLGIFELEAIETLRRSRDELEVKVKERTEDLIKTNKDLEHEIAERKRAEKHITDSLREKEILLSELYHRTKNNMQVISNLIDLEALSISDRDILGLLKETQNRISSMALVHEKLYQSKDLSNVNMRDYVTDLAHAVLTSYQIGRDSIALNLDVDSILVSIDAATPCGLIINELMSNSLKYSFGKSRRGEISLVLHRMGEGEIELSFSDSGAGLPKGIDLNNTKSLGLQLVKNLAEKQLKGKVELRRGQRTEFLITFKEPQYLKRI